MVPMSTVQEQSTLESVMQWQQHYQVAYALQSWEHWPNGNDSVAAQWWQDPTTMAIASWQYLICKMTINHGDGDGNGNGNGSSNPM